MCVYMYIYIYTYIHIYMYKTNGNRNTLQAESGVLSLHARSKSSFSLRYGPASRIRSGSFLKGGSSLGRKEGRKEGRKGGVDRSRSSCKLVVNKVRYHAS